jgi:hypothetical protein
MDRPWDAIIWWEKRRIAFNLTVLAAGVVTLVLLELFVRFYASPGEDLGNPAFLIVGIVVYGIAAKLAYTLGWLTEILWSAGNTRLTEASRVRIYQIGLIFSVALTLLPALLIPVLRLMLDFFLLV